MELHVTKIIIDWQGGGYTTLRIVQYEEKNGCGEVYIEHLIPSFYALQEPGWTKFKEMLKAIWCFLRGKEYLFYDISLSSKEQILALKNGIAQLDENINYDL